MQLKYVIDIIDDKPFNSFKVIILNLQFFSFITSSIQGYVKQGKKNFIVVPIAFVNEHIETLHELDIEYCHELAEEVHESMKMSIFIESAIPINEKYLFAFY